MKISEGRNSQALIAIQTNFRANSLLEGVGIRDHLAQMNPRLLSIEEL